MRAEVTDSGPGFEPQPHTPDRDDGSGWGLDLVEQMTDRWRTTRTGRPCVWFEIDLEGNGSGVAGAGDGHAATAGASAGA